MIKQEIKNIKQSAKDLKKFGITIGTVLFLIALFFLYKGNDLWIIFSGAGLIFIAAAYIVPMILKPVNLIWMTLAILMGWVMTRVILAVLFFIVLTPISLIARLVGKKFLKLKRDSNAVSYWDKRTVTSISKDNYEKQY